MLNEISQRKANTLRSHLHLEPNNNKMQNPKHKIQKTEIGGCQKQKGGVVKMNEGG